MLIQFHRPSLGRCHDCIVATVPWTGKGEPYTQASADVALINGVVITVDNADSVAQAIAITGGKISAVGTNDGIKGYIGGGTEVIDLRGRAVTPGPIDSHGEVGARPRVG